MFEKISAIQITSHQPDTLRDWYRGVVGLTLDAETNCFVVGGLYFAIDSHSKVTAGTLEPWRTMLSFDSDDIRRDYESLKAKGVSFVRPPEQEPWGGILATFVDPDGNYVQIMQLPVEEPAAEPSLTGAAHGG